MSTKHRTLPALEEDYQVLSDTVREFADEVVAPVSACLLYTSPSPRDQRGSRMPSSA